MLEKIQHFPDELIYGWGLDFYTGCITEENEWKTVVDDTHTICHLNSQTFKQNKIDIGIDEFCRNADKKMFQYFINSEYKQLFFNLRAHGEQYSI